MKRDGRDMSERELLDHEPMPGDRCMAFDGGREIDVVYDMDHIGAGWIIGTDDGVSRRVEWIDGMWREAMQSRRRAAER